MGGWRSMDANGQSKQSKASLAVIVDDPQMVIQYMAKACELLDERYKACDKTGHRRRILNYCHHCYRHIEYGTPQTDAIYADHARLPQMMRPLDAPIQHERMRQEVQQQIYADRMEGIRKIMKTLKPGDLEKNVK
jgi:hypothetical protein